ncbi:MAG: hypothetical protein HY080_05765 [Gammaproteobacteria bacterium]|nr:hypothetical protein [Gammaproteobacteria bacterium]
MKSDNPYQPPAATVADFNQPIDGVWQFTDPKHLPAGRGWFWIREGFRLFAKSPWIWIANMIIFFIITIIVAMIPFVSIVNNILQPIFTGGLMRGAQSLDQEGRYEVNHLFAGFRERGSPLAILGAMQLGIIILYFIVIAIVVMILIGTSGLLAQTGGTFDPRSIITSPALFALIPVVFISLLLLGMAFWLAPQLIMLHNLDPFAAIKMSFIGSWRNIVPMIVFSLLAMLVTLVVVVPTIGLGFFVMWPVMIAATYVAWKDIFTNAYPD